MKVFQTYGDIYSHTSQGYSAHLLLRLWSQSLPNATIDRLHRHIIHMQNRGIVPVLIGGGFALAEYVAHELQILGSDRNLPRITHRSHTTQNLTIHLHIQHRHSIINRSPTSIETASSPTLIRRSNQFSQLFFDLFDGGDAIDLLL
jgi:hypothetical protein